MTWDLDVDEARTLAEAFLSRMEPPVGDVWVITTVKERDWGWIISWSNNRAAMGSTETKDLYAGGGPFLVDRKTGRVAMCGSAFPADYYVDAWHRGELPDQARLA